MRHGRYAAPMHECTTPDAPLLELADVNVIRDGRPLLQDIRLAIAQGQHTAILGPNGSGKSTFVRLLERRLYPRAKADGEVRVRMFGRARWSVEALRRLIGVVSSDVQLDFTTHNSMTAREAVLSGFFATQGLRLDHHHINSDMRSRCEDALARMGMQHLATRRLATLSTGEARRVLIARALVHQPRALFLDEPCAGLDIVTRRRFLERLQELARTGTTLIMVTHHVEEILPEIAHVVLLRDGRIFDQGRKGAMLADASLSTLFGMPVSLQQHGPWYAAALR